MSLTTASTAAQLIDVRHVMPHPTGDILLLDGVSAAFPVASLSTIWGRSGAGKSTLAGILAGLDRPTSGQVFVGHQELGALSERGLTRFRRTDVSLVHGGTDLVKSMSGRENLMLPFTISGADPDRSWVDKVVEQAGIAGILDDNVAALTLGQQQLLASARALVTKPSLVVADEPTEKLRSHEIPPVLELFSWATFEQRLAVVLLTSDAQVAASGQVRLVLIDGRLLATEN